MGGRASASGARQRGPSEEKQVGEGGEGEHKPQIPGLRALGIEADAPCHPSEAHGAAYANGGNTARTLVTLWYHPAYDALPDTIQAHLADAHGAALADWPQDARNRIDCLLPYCTSPTEALAIERVPQPMSVS